MPTEQLRGKHATVTIDGEPMAIQDGSYTTATEVDDTTNLLSEGFVEDVDTVKRATCSLTAVYDGLSPPDFDEGDLVALSITQPGLAAVVGPPAVPGRYSGPGISGNFRINSMTYPFVNPRGAVKYSFDAASVGAYVKTRGGEIPV